MKILITENQVKRTAIAWMNMNFSPDQLEIVTSKEYPDSIFYKKNGKVVMEQDKENKYFFFHYHDIWSFFEDFFGLEYKEIQGVLKSWLEDTLKLEGYTPFQNIKPDGQMLEDTLKLEGYTPGVQFREYFSWLEDTFKLE